MRRYLKYGFLSLLVIVLVLLAVANSQPVQLHLVPSNWAAFFPFPITYDLPLFVVVFAGLLLGVALGYFGEYLREHKHRRAVSQERRAKAALQNEVKALREQTGQNKDRDDVLAIVEG